MSENLRDNARSLLENWRSSLPNFVLTNKVAWNEYLETCIAPTHREVARLVANIAHRLDEYYILSDGRILEPNSSTFKANFEIAVSDSQLVGYTTQQSIEEALTVLREVSMWKKYLNLISVENIRSWYS